MKLEPLVVELSWRVTPGSRQCLKNNRTYMSAISHPVQLLPSSWSRWFHKMSKCFSVKTWLSLLVLMIQWGAFDECVCSSSQWMLGLVPYVERPFVCCFLNSVFCVFFIYLFLPPLSKLTEEQGEIIFPFARKLCVFWRMLFLLEKRFLVITLRVPRSLREEGSELFIRLTCPNTHKHVCR